MSNINKLKRFQAWRTGEDERTLADTINFNISDAINGVIEEHSEMYEVLERLINPKNCKKDIIHIIGNAESLLAKARGENQ
mgnify:CR=1 FL=1